MTDEKINYWFRMWEVAYSEHHPLVALYALTRATLRAIRVDLSILVKKP